eukprot:2214811-Pyramimonas_sp.AAC.1
MGGAGRRQPRRAAHRAAPDGGRADPSAAPVGRRGGPRWRGACCGSRRSQGAPAGTRRRRDPRAR